MAGKLISVKIVSQKPKLSQQSIKADIKRLIMQFCCVVHDDSCLENSRTEYIGLFMLCSNLVEVLKMPRWTGWAVVFTQMPVTFYDYSLMFDV